MRNRIKLGCIWAQRLIYSSVFHCFINGKSVWLKCVLVCNGFYNIVICELWNNKKQLFFRLTKFDLLGNSLSTTNITVKIAYIQAPRLDWFFFYNMFCLISLCLLVIVQELSIMKQGKLSSQP